MNTKSQENEIHYNSEYAEDCNKKKRFLSPLIPSSFHDSFFAPTILRGLDYFAVRKNLC